MIRRLDATALRLATFVAHAVQRLTGVISYRLAQQFIMVEVVRLIVAIADYWAPDTLPRTTAGWELALFGFGMLFLVLIVAILGRVADRWQDNPNALPAEVLEFDNASPIMRISVLLMRVSIAPFTVATFIASGISIEIVFDVASYGLPIGMYIALVPPLPPAQDRVLVLATSEG